MTDKYREYEAEKRRLADECNTQAEFEERLIEVVERLKI